MLFLKLLNYGTTNQFENSLYKPCNLFCRISHFTHIRIEEFDIETHVKINDDFRSIFNS